jgi:hypothetical protein
MPEWLNLLHNLFFRYADRIVPSKWFLPHVPPADQVTLYRGRLSIEIVSHCWNYSHLLAYNLSSLVNHPPQDIDVTMTVFYCSEDQGTVDMLEYFSGFEVARIKWNWCQLTKGELLRRAIGRNKAALETKASWVWYIDCDLIFHQGCLDSLAKSLQGRCDALLYPQTEQITSLLEDENPMLNNGRKPDLIEIDPSQFHTRSIPRAVGAYQITHGDIARACGYCNNIRVYQTPTNHWRKTYEDRTYRWLLGTQGKAIEIPHIYRIRHIAKGRYKKGTLLSKIRMFTRTTESTLGEKRSQKK